MRKILKPTVLLTIAILAISLSGCREKEQPKQNTGTYNSLELTVYNVFDNEDIFAPMLQAFRSEYGSNLKINYRKFSDLTEYRETILNELAEGEGPDIFFMHNSWFYQDHKKLLPAPASVTRQDFLDSYVEVAANDLIIPDETGAERIYSFPLYVDTLALFYNREYYNNEIPERGKPPATWSQLEEDILKLRKEDKSFERFKVAGIAMGRADNILRSSDILLTLMLQNGLQFYNDEFTQAELASTQGINPFGKPNTPGVDALDFYTSFGLPNNRNYTWNAFLSDTNTSEQEVDTFVKGKVAMIFGYSYLYEDIVRQINILAKRNPSIIEVSDVAVAPMPQVFDPEEGIGNMATLASYFSPVVARTTEDPELAWALISFFTNQENSRYYHEQTKRPTARRDLIAEQSQDPIYGVFAKQLGVARTVPMVNALKYNQIFDEMITQVMNTVQVKVAIKNGQDAINELIPDGGLFPGPAAETVRDRLEREATERSTSEETN